MKAKIDYEDVNRLISAFCAPVVSDIGPNEERIAFNGVLARRMRVFTEGLLRLLDVHFAKTENPAPPVRRMKGNRFTKEGHEYRAGLHSVEHDETSDCHGPEPRWDCQPAKVKAAKITPEETPLKLCLARWQVEGSLAPTGDESFDSPNNRYRRDWLALYNENIRLYGELNRSLIAASKEHQENLRAQKIIDARSAECETQRAQAKAAQKECARMGLAWGEDIQKLEAATHQARAGGLLYSRVWECLQAMKHEVHDDHRVEKCLEDSLKEFLGEP